MRTSIFLGVMAATLTVAGIIGPAFAVERNMDLSQTAVGGNINTNHQSNDQSSSQTAKATTVSTNINAPSSSIDQGGRNSFNVGVSSQNANQASDATTTQTQSSTQNAANFNANLQTFRLTQTAVCAVIASC
jgi:hypothetical protein